MPFSSLPSPIAGALAARGFESLTPVQGAVLAPDAENRDLIVSARTGSGKTVAFGLAMADLLLGEGESLPERSGPLALIIAPTRELALQVSQELDWLYGAANARIATCVGGMDPNKERRALNRGAHIVVGTPGRLCDHLRREALDLSALRCVVLDEADEMLDMGFREDLEFILDATPEARRTLLFSATMPKPILTLARRYQRDALRVSTLDAAGSHADIAYEAVTVAPGDVERAVVNLLRFHEAETTMLFCATREGVRRLNEQLLARGFSAVALSGEHTQKERNQALAALREGRARVCVATDVAARGIDVATIGLVVHVELPRDAEVLQHRSGRTGRAGRKGIAVLVVPHARRKRTEAMLREAKIDIRWRDVPTADMIRTRDRDRLMAALQAPFTATGDEREIAAQLVEAMAPEALALALVRAHTRETIAPEDVVATAPDLAPRKKAWTPDGRKPGKRPFKARAHEGKPAKGAKPKFKRKKAG